MSHETRFERAIRLWLHHGESSDGSLEQLRQAHPDLADLFDVLSEQGDGHAEDSAEVEHGALGDFQILRELGRGGTAIVYEARQRSLDRLVALKLPLAGTGCSPGAIARIRREARTLARLDHPSIVRVVAVLGGDDVGYAMELVDGRPIDRDARDARSVAALVATVAEALHHAHEAGIVHRDVKPANILVRADGRAVLTDFGLALAEDLPSLTRTGGFAGTPFYVSPEQAGGRPADRRSDVFSLGVTLYELLTGRRPFEGDTSAQVLAAIESGRYVDPRRLGRGLPRDLVAIVCRAIESRPERRYQTAAAFAADLRAWSTGRAVVARPPSRARAALRWMRREPWRAAALLALLLAAGAGGYLIAKAPLLHDAEQRLASERRELLLGEGAAALLVGDRTAAQRCFDEVLEAGERCDEAVAGRALAAPDAVAAVAILDAAAMVPDASLTLRALRDDLVTGSPPGTRTPIDALDAYVSGLRALTADTQARHAEPQAWRQRLRAALRALGVATRLSERPRLAHYVVWANTAANVGDAAACSEVAEALLRLWPGSRTARAARTVALTGCDPVAARSAMEAAVLEQPEDWRAWANLMFLTHSQGDLERSLTAARRCAELMPAGDQAFAHSAVAERLDLTGRDAEALVEWQRVLELEPTHSNAHYHVALAASARGDHSAAITHLEAAVRSEPGFAEAWNNLGMARDAAGDPQGAITALRRARDVDPGLAPAHGNLLRMHRARGDRPALLDELRNWVAARPGDAAGWRRLAVELLVAGPPAVESDQAAGLQACLQALVADGGSEPADYVLLARALGRGDRDAARSVLDAASLAMPGSREVLDAARLELLGEAPLPQPEGGTSR